MMTVSKPGDRMRQVYSRLGTSFGALYTDLAVSGLERRCNIGFLPPMTIVRLGTRVLLEINRIADEAVGLVDTKNGIADTTVGQLTLFCIGRPSHSSVQPCPALFLMQHFVLPYEALELVHAL